MKTTIDIFRIVFVLLFISCGQRNDSKEIPKNITENFQTKADSIESERLKKRKQIEEEDKQDSIRLEKVLKVALDSARGYINLEKFKREFVVKCDTAYDVNVEINLDYHFTNKYPHLIIRRVNPYVVLIDVLAP